MGLKMTDTDIDNMVNDLDFDKDGSISLNEFEIWWLSGRKGSTGTMS
jgi:Ca2+-binding EF-hand superfamily protein